MDELKQYMADHPAVAKEMAFTPDSIIELLRPLYALKQGGHDWQNTVRATMEAMGFRTLKSDSGVYYNDRTGGFRHLSYRCNRRIRNCRRDKNSHKNPTVWRLLNGQPSLVLPVLLDDSRCAHHQLPRSHILPSANESTRINPHKSTVISDGWIDSYFGSRWNALNGRWIH
jgi:hypothetical protein